MPLVRRLQSHLRKPRNWDVCRFGSRWWLISRKSQKRIMIWLPWQKNTRTSTGRRKHCTADTIIEDLLEVEFHCCHYCLYVLRKQSKNWSGICGLVKSGFSWLNCMSFTLPRIFDTEFCWSEFKENIIHSVLLSPCKRITQDYTFFRASKYNLFIQLQLLFGNATEFSLHEDAYIDTWSLFKKFERQWGRLNRTGVRPLRFVEL